MPLIPWNGAPIKARLNADIQSWDLSTVLNKIGALTGWKVYVEPGDSTTNTVSVKFKNLSEDEALRRLLGKLSYTKDKTNGVTRPLVFRTAQAGVMALAPAGEITGKVTLKGTPPPETPIQYR